MMELKECMNGIEGKKMPINSTFSIQHSKLIIPDGTMKKLTDVSKLHSLGWHHKIDLEEGIMRMYDWYKRL